MKRILTVLALVLAVVASRGSIVETQSPAAEFVAGELLIQFQPGTTAADRADARSWVGAVRRELLRGNGNGELEVARVPATRRAGRLSRSCGSIPRCGTRNPTGFIVITRRPTTAITRRDCCGACTATPRTPLISSAVRRAKHGPRAMSGARRLLVPVETADEPLMLREPCEAGLSCFDPQPSDRADPRLSRPCARQVR